MPVIAEIEINRLIPSAAAQEALNAAVVSLLGNKTSGIGKRKEKAIVFLLNSVTTEEDSAVRQLVAEWDFSTLTASQQAAAARASNIASVIADFDASALANKTPAEIATYVSNEIAGWVSLADAKTDLANWLPKISAILAWLVVEKAKAD